MKLQQKRELLEEIKYITKPSFIPTDIIRAHRGVKQQFKLKARNGNAIDIETAINSMCNTLYNLIRDNGNNATERIFVGITENFSKPKEVLDDRDLVDPAKGIVHRRGTVLIPTNERVFDDKYHHSNIFKLHPRSSIRKLLDKLIQSLNQNREDNMARLEGASNHKLEFINNIYIKFHEINPPKTRSYIPTPKKLLNKNAIINPQNKDSKCFLYATAILFYYDEIDKKHPSRISKNLLKCCERLNIDNIESPPKLRILSSLKKIIVIFQLQYLNMTDFIK